MFYWESIIWFASFHKPVGKDNYLAKKRNTVSKKLSIIFLVSSDDTPNRGNLTLEIVDRKFGSIWFIM